MFCHLESVATVMKNGVRNKVATGSKVLSVTKFFDLYRCGTAARCSLSSCNKL